MPYSQNRRNNGYGAARRASAIAVIRGASARRPATRPARQPHLSANERFAPIVIGEDGRMIVHPDYQ